jgi:hypothetical protein
MLSSVPPSSSPSVSLPASVSYFPCAVVVVRKMKWKSDRGCYAMTGNNRE